MNSKKIALRDAAKYSLFTLIVFMLYVLQGTPGFLQIFGVKPIFLIAFCINLAMLDGESPKSMIIYIVAGFLFELSAGRLVGMYTLPLLVCCIAAAIAVKFFFKANYRNTCVFSLASMILILSIDFLFNYILPGHKGSGIVYLKTVLLSSVYSIIFSPLYYKIIMVINEKFRRFDAR